MRLQTLYRHVNNTTVAFEIHKRFYVPETGVWKLKVGWWNIGSRHDPWPLLITQNIQIPDAKVAEWLPMGRRDRAPAPRMEII